MQIQFSLSLPLLLILTVCSQPSQSKNPFYEINGVLGYIYDVNETITTVRSDIDQLDKDLSEFDNARMGENYIKVLQHFKKISKQVDQIDENHVTLPKKTLYEYIFNKYNDLNDFQRMVHEMKDISEIFLNFSTIANSDNDNLLISFAEEVALTSVFVSNDFYWKLNGNPFVSKEVLSKLRQSYEMPLEKICHSLQSPQQLVYSLYKDTALIELKAYILYEYSLLIRRVSGQRNLIPQTNTIRLNYKNISEDALDTLITTMGKADRVLWRCDPEKHVPQVTYDEVTRLLQGYIENEVDLNTTGSCSESCPDYRNSTRMGCFEQKFCSQQPQCLGRLHDCQFVDSDLSVCQSPESSNRRYEYIEESGGQRFGEQEKCSRDVNNVESWRRWIFWQCSYCFCLCDEPSPKSDRYFSLRETYADVRANRVVTGVRFVKKNRIFHIQIQQGQLLPRGAINASTLEWVPVDDFKLNDFNVTEGVDYHAMSYEKRRINLDETVFRNGRTFIVTGVSFNVWKERLELQVLVSQFNFKRGRVDSYNMDKDLVPLSMFSVLNNPLDSKKVNIEDLDIPTRSPHSSQPILKSVDQYLEFANTGLEKDAGQTTIPFIDIQDVVSNPPVPLSGLGIYYKSSPGYGGFVAPKIISYDFAAYVRMPTSLP
ncbi:hypothetical protein KR044_009330 [Drosophila immigrans]|nr:hypothetical protein KR044_009330 [Drosophila immigrans]